MVSTSDTRSSPAVMLNSSAAASVSPSVPSSCISRRPTANTLLKIGSSTFDSRAFKSGSPWRVPSGAKTIARAATPSRSSSCRDDAEPAVGPGDVDRAARPAASAAAAGSGVARLVKP